MNEIAWRGIPDSTELMDGDLVSAAVGMYVNGWHGYTCRSFCCGDVDKCGKKLIETVEEAVNEVVKICKPGVEYSEIGYIIEEIAHRNRFNT